VNDYLAQGNSPAQAAQKAAADATRRGYTAQAVYNSETKNWAVDFTGNCNNHDIVIDVDTICTASCGGTPPGGETPPLPPSPVITPTPPTPSAPSGGNNDGGDDGGEPYVPPSNNSPSVSPSIPNNQLATTAPCTTNTYLSWSFSDPEDGTNQSGYQIQIATNGSFSSIAYDTGSVSSGIKERYVTVGSQINFNTTYYWRIRVQDSQGAWSSYVTGSVFSTPVHAAPTPSYISSPEHPSTGETVQFTSTSTASGGASIAGYEWSFTGGTPSSANSESVEVVFSAEGDKATSLRVTDSDGISCSTESILTIEQKLPDIREVPPLSMVGNFFSGVFTAFGIIADAAF
ncbi:MAG: PKD domain-containing protein, partial [Candidatus Spechtbacterales bacterium]